MKIEKRIKTENTVKHLLNLGYTIKECTNGHLIVNTHISYWATTGKWHDFKYEKWGVGLHSLLTYTGYFNKEVKNSEEQK